MFKHKTQKPNNKVSDDDLRHQDTDNDGLTDYEEVNIYGTNPYDPDSDKDGMNDGDEVRNGRNPLGAGTLKDLFIPHSGNKYQPSILNPRRLIFYSATVVAIKILIVSFVFLFPAGAWLVPDLMIQESRKVIALTNTLRHSLNVPGVVESSILNQAAYNKAEDMLIQQYFAHVGPDGKDVTRWLLASGYIYQVAGENLAMGFANANDVVEAWKKSPTHYSNLIDSDFSEIGVGMSSGLYNGADTTLVAQFFGTSRSRPTPAPAPISEPVPEPKPRPELEIPVHEPIQPNEQPALTEVLDEKIDLEPTPQVPIPEPVVVPVIPTPVPEPILVPKPVIPEVVVPVIKDELVSPVLIMPKDNIINSNDFQVIVYAPEAEVILVYDYDTKIAFRNSLNSDFFDLNLTLRNGQHNLSFKAVKGDRDSISQTYLVTVEEVQPEIDAENSKLLVVEPPGQTEKIIKAVASLSDDVTKAHVSFNDYKIELEKIVDSSEEGFSQWVGQLVVFEKDKRKIFSTIILPEISVENKIGSTAIASITWENIVPIQPSLLKQYLFIKSYPLKQVDWIFNISGYYYKLLLAIAIIALLMNIFIKIKKQYPQTIISTLGFIILLVVLIMI